MRTPQARNADSDRKLLHPKQSSRSCEFSAPAVATLTQSQPVWRQTSFGPFHAPVVNQYHVGAVRLPELELWYLPAAELGFRIDSLPNASLWLLRFQNCSQR